MNTTVTLIPIKSVTIEEKSEKLPTPNARVEANEENPERIKQSYEENIVPIKYKTSIKFQEKSPTFLGR